MAIGYKNSLWEGGGQKFAGLFFTCSNMTDLEGAGPLALFKF